MKQITNLVLMALSLVGITLAFAFRSETKTGVGAYLEITLQVKDADRGNAANVYSKFKQPFLSKVKGAVSKELLLRLEDVQVVHGFNTVADAEAYLKTDLFNKDVVSALKPYLQASPEIRIYTVFTTKK